MFYSIAIPGILPAQAVGAQFIAPAHRTERSHASMTAEKSTGSQEAEGLEAEYPQMGRQRVGYPQEMPLQVSARPDNIQALSMLYERFRRPIHSYIYRLLGNQEDADDVTQEVFVRACTAWGGLYDRDNLSAWLYRIATNLCVDLLRRRKRISWWPLARRYQDDGYGEGAIEDDISCLLSVSGGIPEVVEREHIRLALASIPHEYAIALVLSAAQGVPYQEIAAIVGISPNAAATRISRAKRMFAKQYQRLSQEGVAKEEQ